MEYLELLREVGALAIVLVLVLKVIPGIYSDCRNEREADRNAQNAAVGQLSEKLGDLAGEVKRLKIEAKNPPD